MTKKEERNILKLNEINTFFLIDECGAFIFRMTHDMNKGRIPIQDFAGINYDVQNVHKTQKFVVSNLHRFGIDPKSTIDNENGDYWKWYRFWNNWKRELSDEDWKKINVIIKENSNADLTEFLPTKKWND
jgi:hypothetical protein